VRVFSWFRWLRDALERISEPREYKEYYKWWAAQVHALESGEEIEPPWVVNPHSEPWSPSWQQGSIEAWKDSIWRPFWKRLSEEERVAYVNKWKAPADWREYLLDPDRYFGRKG